MRQKEDVKGKQKMRLKEDVNGKQKMSDRIEKKEYFVNRRMKGRIKKIER